jgi:formate dehydrogenase gamma subunit
MMRRKMSSDMFPNMSDVQDAWHMLQYLFFLRKDKPAFGKYNFEQKVTYWFLFFGFAMMGISGFIIWFPAQFTKFLPGGIVPASKMAHSTEAIVAAIFIVVWHLYHVHIERLNLSIFTGRLNEGEMRKFHAKEYERITREPAIKSDKER